jgi:hypothetical protein
LCRQSDQLRPFKLQRGVPLDRRTDATSVIVFGRVLQRPPGRPGSVPTDLAPLSKNRPLISLHFKYYRLGWGVYVPLNFIKSSPFAIPVSRVYCYKRRCLLNYLFGMIANTFQFSFGGIRVR